MTNKNFNNEKINSNGYDYVDLGLPSGTLWATCNVGAKRPSDFGLYFQWGDIQGYTKEQVGKDKQFKRADYKWNPSGDGETLTKYANTGASLELEDDAASANMGGDWHIPTPTQFSELIADTTSAWTAQDGVNGRLFTSKKDPSKSIFIPAAGNAWVGSVRNSGDSGNVWSSMLNKYIINLGQNFAFHSKCAFTWCHDRNYGLPVRGVIDKINDDSKNKKSNMNEILNLVEILKDAPKGMKLWSPLIGECELFNKDFTGETFPIVCIGVDDGIEWKFNADGTYTENADAECVLFPSKENRDWSTFNVPTHKHFEPFQKVLCMVVSNPGCKIWSANFYNHYDEDKKQHYLVGGFLRNDDEVISYEGNEDKLGKPANN